MNLILRIVVLMSLLLAGLSLRAQETTQVSDNIVSESTAPSAGRSATDSWRALRGADAFGIAGEGMCAMKEGVQWVLAAPRAWIARKMDWDAEGLTMAGFNMLFWVFIFYLVWTGVSKIHDTIRYSANYWSLVRAFAVISGLCTMLVSRSDLAASKIPLGVLAFALVVGLLCSWSSRRFGVALLLVVLDFFLGLVMGCVLHLLIAFAVLVLILCFLGHSESDGGDSGPNYYSWQCRDCGNHWTAPHFHPCRECGSDDVFRE